MRTHGSPCRRRGRSSPLLVCSLSKASNSLRAAVHSSSSTTLCSVIPSLLSYADDSLRSHGTDERGNGGRGHEHKKAEGHDRHRNRHVHEGFGREKLLG